MGLVSPNAILPPASTWGDQHSSPERNPSGLPFSHVLGTPSFLLYPLPLGSRVRRKSGLFPGDRRDNPIFGTRDAFPPPRRFLFYAPFLGRP